MKTPTYKSIRVTQVTGHKFMFLGAFENDDEVLPAIEQTEISSATKTVAAMDSYGEWHYGAVAVV